MSDASEDTSLPRARATADVTSWRTLSSDAGRAPVAPFWLTVARTSVLAAGFVRYSATSALV